MLNPGYSPSPETLAALEAGDVEALLAASRARFGGFLRMEEGSDGGDAGADAGADSGDDAGADAGDTGDAADAGADSGAEDSRVKRANAEAARYRTALRAQETEVASLKETLSKLAAVFSPGADEPDPAALTGQVETLTGRAAQLEAELLVHTIAGTNGGNPVALLDSRTFTNALHKLDASADDYADQVATAIKEAVSKNANLSSGAGQGPARGGASGAGQGSAEPSGAVTQEQFDAMGYPERAALFNTNPDLYRRLAGSS